MARSQLTFAKKEREKKKAQKKKEKQAKKDSRREQESKGAEIDWGSAPVNKTLTEHEKKQMTQNEKLSK